MKLVSIVTKDRRQIDYFATDTGRVFHREPFSRDWREKNWHQRDNDTQQVNYLQDGEKLIPAIGKKFPNQIAVTMCWQWPDVPSKFLPDVPVQDWRGELDRKVVLVDGTAQEEPGAGGSQTDPIVQA